MLETQHVNFRGHNSIHNTHIKCLFALPSPNLTKILTVIHFLIIHSTSKEGETSLNWACKWTYWKTMLGGMISSQLGDHGLKKSKHFMRLLALVREALQSCPYQLQKTPSFCFQVSHSRGKRPPGMTGTPFMALMKRGNFHLYPKELHRNTWCDLSHHTN